MYNVKLDLLNEGVYRHMMDNTGVRSAVECEEKCCQLGTDACNIASFVQVNGVYTCYTSLCTGEYLSCVSQATGGHVSALFRAPVAATPEEISNASNINPSTTVLPSTTVRPSTTLLPSTTVDVSTTVAITQDDGVGQVGDTWSQDEEAAVDEWTNFINNWNDVQEQYEEPAWSPEVVSSDEVSDSDNSYATWETPAGDREGIVGEGGTYTQPIQVSSDDWNTEAAADVLSEETHEIQEMLKEEAEELEEWQNFDDELEEQDSWSVFDQDSRGPSYSSLRPRRTMSALTVGLLIAAAVFFVVILLVVRKIRSGYSKIDYRKYNEIGNTEKEPLYTDTASYID